MKLLCLTNPELFHVEHPIFKSFLFELITIKFKAILPLKEKLNAASHT